MYNFIYIKETKKKEKKIHVYGLSYMNLFISIFWLDGGKAVGQLMGWETEVSRLTPKFLAEQLAFY